MESDTILYQQSSMVMFFFQ